MTLGANLQTNNIPPGADVIGFRIHIDGTLFEGTLPLRI